MIDRNTIISHLEKELSNYTFSAFEEEASFDRYFEPKFNINFEFYSFLLFDIKIAIVLKGTHYSVATLEYHYSDNYPSIFYRDKLDDRYLAKAMLAYGFNILKYKDDFINKIDSVIKDIDKENRERNKREFLDKLNQQIDLLDRTEIVKDGPEIHLFPIINLDNSNSLYITVKIGFSKQYSVPAIGRLIYRFNDKTFYSYGKELAFTHDESVLDEKSRTLLGILRGLKFGYDDTGKYLPLDNDSFGKILDIYRGQNLVFEKEKKTETYNVRLQDLKAKIFVDKDFVLKAINFDKEKYLGYGRYVLNKEEKTVDLLAKDDPIANLISVVMKSDYPCIEDNIEDFKYAYVLRYPESFIFDKSIEDDFVFEELLIKAYFDFDNKVISVKEELFVDGEMVSPKKLTKYNQSQYRRYQSILRKMGFVDGFLTNDEDIWNFLNSNLSSLKTVAEVYLSESVLNKSVSNFNAPTIRIDYKNNMLDVLMEESRYNDEELIAILDAIKKKKKYVLLKNQVIGVDNESSKQFLDNSDNYDLYSKKEISKHVSLPLYYAFKSLNNQTGLSINEQIYNVFDLIKNFKISKFKPGKINGELRGYQVEGVKWLDILYKHHLGGILADDMGLGKTIEIISFLKGEKIEGNTLIVCPKTLLFNWQNEFRKFAPDMKVVGIYGNADTRKSIIEKIPQTKNTVYVSGYESVRRDIELYNDIKFDTLILDEAQYIKNSKAKKSLSIYSLQGDHRYALTGTPIENSVLDLWSIFNFLMPNYLLDIHEFKANYEFDNDYADNIRKLVAPFILRRNKKDVLKDLPDKFETIMTCEMNNEQRKMYDAHILLARQTLQKEGKAFDVLPLLTRLRQICIEPSLFVANYHGGSSKIETLCNIIDEKLSEGHRILIFSQFVKALDLVENKLKQRDIKYFVITGETDSEERVKLANEFNASRKYKIGLVSLKAGGTGLNLVGADTVIHLDPWWNVAVEDQATDRAYRIGQERNVEVIKLICEESIEQRVVELQNIKKDLFDKVISDNDSSITSLSLEDINFILNT